MTTEPIDTPEHIAASVDVYIKRWLIEEFFKAIKTGCRYEQRQLKTANALLIDLAIENVIAWRLLLAERQLHLSFDDNYTCVFSST